MTPIGDLHISFGGLPAEVQAEVVASSALRHQPADSRLLSAGRVTTAVNRIVDGQANFSAWDCRSGDSADPHGPRDWVGLAEVFNELPVT